MLVLFYDTLWGAPLETDGVPPGFELTTDRRRYAEANAVVFHLPQWARWRFPRLSRWRRLLAPSKLPGQLWVAWSMESAENYPLMRDPRFMRRFDLTMTYELASDVPVTYSGGYDRMRQLRQPPPPKVRHPLVASFISSAFNRSGRKEYVHELARHLPIDSYGRFMRNRSLPNDRGVQSKLEAIARYKFTLAFENSCAPDYVTEKFFDPLMAGSVPVYLGAPNVADFAPGDHCYIDVADFSNPRALAEYLIAVGNDEAAYGAYFSWKTKPFRAAFQRLLALSTPHAFVRLCHLIRARVEA